MKTGFLSVDKSLEEAARSNGANERQVFAYITLPLAYRSFVTAYVLDSPEASANSGLR